MMDMQTVVLERNNAKGVVTQVAILIAKARKEGIPVIYINAGFRKNAPEISSNNKFFEAYKDYFQKADPAQSMLLPESIMPLPNDIIMQKRRFGAFEGSELELILRSKNIKHIILCGVSTSGVVLSTVREAADKDYLITVVSDACADNDPEVQRVLMEKIFPVQADVITTAQLTK
ncbi:cysteine hydrolase family protein [Flavobacterium sp. ZS1P14]|uniref:cysteine hydrolase family protein n=1 Tax=Flavobacterium sp. ZS1P14 TaxID=3401729 RepID=UPI003AAC5F40